ncbi:hypothetical protein AGMMS49938_16490 [Fibrobacterales bacterium]|nr:hypothetical protein AGMMS49938_16490 [Fibrobacterales bacterium]
MKSLIAFFALSFSLAFSAENFGGIGLAVYSTNGGAGVEQVVIGSPADSAGIKNGDLLISADGNSLEEKSLADVKNILRGKAGFPIDLEILRSNDTLRFTLIRAPLKIQEANTQNTNLQKNKGDKFLAKVATHNKPYNVYLEGKDSTKTKSPTPVPEIAITAFSREVLTFDAKHRGNANVKIISTDGDVKAIFAEVSVNTGSNSLNWDGANLPKGTYIVHFEHNGKIISSSAVLH